MYKKLVLAASLAVAFAMPVAAQSGSDPYSWLEEIEGERALDWVRAENARSLAILEDDPHFAAMRAEALAILTSPARIPTGAIHNGALYNFWQDETHVRGLWRRASVASYRNGAPDWEILIDFDKLARDEGENWVSGQFVCLSPEYRHCMVELSRGGGDASTWREFDTSTRAFVKGGFLLPEAKSAVSWVDADTLLVGTDWGQGSLTESGYPRILKTWPRGKALGDATTYFEASSGDVAVRSRVDQDNGAQVFVLRGISFFDTEFFFATGLSKPSKLPLPLNSNLQGVLDGRAIFFLQQAWRHQDRDYPQGSVIAYDLETGGVELVFAASDAQSVESVGVGESGLVIQYLENVSGRAARVERSDKGEWRAGEIQLPANGVIKIASAGGGTDDALLSFESLVMPPSLYFVTPANRVERIFQAPAVYDASDVVVEQRFAVSTDGTRIPYFVMGRKAVLEKGDAPTVQYAYGGFLRATLPVYYEDPSRPQHGALAGRLWVSRGGVLVLANIRGGSEYGPRWHQAGLRENRQKVFDDFISVSEDLIRRGVTSPGRLGAIGRSNGGLLMGAVVNQRPELYSAVVIGVPLLDMRRYTKLGAGASWVAEYGDPDTADWSYMSKWSPYQNMRENVAYPRVFYYTSTRDDRVHPGHARKAAAKMRSLGRDYFYYENVEGGHGGTANQGQLAYRIALEYTYFARMLMGAHTAGVP
ncbi:MAG: prolyl oligopeptidase family serine peptidase [Steroidobacteraceae bacterium]|nr:prolyl oligopeptidase family serine peptidase [Steroidobacteraceae bacterium]